ncbi:OX-2 membrane glycoprotein-like [Brienomyrus brachyistius]|uniref:OX-2 membrane glycoprotein-like n=1 Tax=Brienomyrus brachyistius TaxID=42636 RepID=UPI0020B34E4D|nr:OX-2 membrane glycoprotein-like [Brienomyrus brachyistius]XP_048871791.1 OX-2 membrane glycoprotein-like [Brienomyrus brachyistius]
MQPVESTDSRGLRSKMDARALISMLFFSSLSTGFSTEISAEGDTSAAFGEDASFSCHLSDPKGVSQVTWQAVKNNVLHDLATYSTRFGENVKKSNIVFSEALLNSTSITVKRVSMADECCYVCTFHVYPSGSVREKMCLTVYGISDMSTNLIPINKETPQDAVVISCSATGKPAPEVTWSRSDWQVEKWVVHNEDGTATVSINRTLDKSDLKDEYVDCVAGSRFERIYLFNSTILPSQGEIHKDFSYHPGAVAGVLTILVLVVLLALLIKYGANREKGCARSFIQRCHCYSMVASERESQAAERCLPTSSCLSV